MWIHPKRNADIALQTENYCLTYETLHEQIGHKLYLLNSNALNGLRVALDLPESFTLIQWTGANWLAGNTVLILDQRLKPAEKEWRLRDFSPDIVISCLEQPSGTMQTFQAEVPVIVEDYNIERRYRSEQQATIESEQAMLVLYSSGSTGMAKQICRTRSSLEQELTQYAKEPLSPDEHSAVLCMASVTHAYGLLSACFHTLHVGGTVHVPALVKPAELVRIVEQHQITHMYGVLFHYQLLEGSLKKLADTGCKPICLSSGGSLPVALIERYKEAGLSLGNQYGMSELGYIAVDFTGAKPGYAGPVASHHRWSLDETGQLVITLDQSPYSATQQNWQPAPSGGKLLTQDIAVMNEHGHISIQGRVNRQVSVGGLKVDLDEVEQKLATHPHLEGCCVVGMDHPVYGTMIEAFIVWNDNGELPFAELKSWLRIELADYKIPRGFRAVEEIPVSATGKVLRGELIKESWHGYQTTG